MVKRGLCAQIDEGDVHTIDGHKLKGSADLRFIQNLLPFITICLGADLDVVTLPHVSQLACCQLLEDEKLVMYSEDLRCMCPVAGTLLWASAEAGRQMDYGWSVEFSRWDGLWALAWLSICTDDFSYMALAFQVTGR